MRTIYVKEYVRSDGTVVRAHTRRIEEVSELIFAPEKQGDLGEFIKEILMSVYGTMNRLSKRTTKKISNKEYSSIVKYMQQLQYFEKLGQSYIATKELAMDTTQFEKEMLALANEIKSDSMAEMSVPKTKATNPVKQEQGQLDAESQNNKKASITEKIDEIMDCIDNSANRIEKFAKKSISSACKIPNEIFNSKNILTKNLMEYSLDGVENIKSADFKLLPKDSARIINEKYGLKGTNKEIPDTWLGIAYSQDSFVSKKLSESKELQEQILSNYSKKNNNNGHIIIDFKKDRDLYLSIGHCTILNGNIDNEGYFTGLLFDKYDFELSKNSGYSYSNLLIGTANDIAFLLQNIGIIKNYFIIVPIKFKVK